MQSLIGARDQLLAASARLLSTSPSTLDQGYDTMLGAKRRDRYPHVEDPFV
jgi:hypothetical protein